MKQKRILSGIILLIMVMPLLSADILRPGYTHIPINNYITNVNDFPEYVFITVGGGPMCSIYEIQNGVIESQYKFCSLNVYAVEKNKFKEEDIPDGKSQTYNEDVETYLTGVNAIKVIDNIHFYKEVPIFSTEKAIKNYYSIDLNQVKEKPDKIDTKKNNLFYVYIIVPIIALLIILFIIHRKMRK